MDFEQYKENFLKENPKKSGHAVLMRRIDDKQLDWVNNQHVADYIGCGWVEEPFENQEDQDQGAESKKPGRPKK